MKFPSHPVFWWIPGETLSGEFPKVTPVESISAAGRMKFTRSKITIFFVLNTLELRQHVTMLNSQHGNSKRWFLHLVSPTHHTNAKGWMELMSCGWGGEIFTAVLACILPQAQSYLQPRMHEPVRSPPLPRLHMVCSWGWHFSRRRSYPHPRPHLLVLCPHPLRSVLGPPTTLAELTPFCSSPQVPQLRNSWHISTRSELWVDSGLCGMRRLR